MTMGTQKASTAVQTSRKSRYPNFRSSRSEWGVEHQGIWRTQPPVVIWNDFTRTETKSLVELHGSVVAGLDMQVCLHDVTV
jgi:hypothetical protein